MLGHCCPSVATDCPSIQLAPRHRTEQHSLSVRAARAPLPNRKCTALKTRQEPGYLLREMTDKTSVLGGLIFRRITHFIQRHGPPHPGFRPDGFDPIREARYEAEVFTNMLLTDQPHRYDMPR
jgi:hypothetical protein